jgi:hypothetical protein
MGYSAILHRRAAGLRTAHISSPRGVRQNAPRIAKWPTREIHPYTY